MTEKMRAIGIYSNSLETSQLPNEFIQLDVKPGGGVEGLYINPDVAKPIPTPEQCLIRVKAFGLNRGDTLQREGRYPPPPGITQTMGLEFAGTVETVGGPENQDSEWKEGDEVFGLLYGGGYAEFVVVDKRMLIRKPKELSWEVCGGLCEVRTNSDSTSLYSPARTCVSDTPNTGLVYGSSGTAPGG